MQLASNLAGGVAAARRAVEAQKRELDAVASRAATSSPGGPASEGVNATSAEERYGQGTTQHGPRPDESAAQQQQQDQGCSLAFLLGSIASNFRRRRATARATRCAAGGEESPNPLRASGASLDPRRLSERALRVPEPYSVLVE